MKGILTISVIVPTVQTHLCEEMLETLFENTVVPRQVIIINNNPDREVGYKNTEEVRGSWGVNRSWQEGINRVLPDTDIVSILNDDILLNKRFFEGIQSGFISYLKAGIICPSTAHTIEEFRNRVANSPIQKKKGLDLMRRREGWAFSIRKFLLDKIPPIPTKLTTFYGDDWIFSHCHQLGYYWVRDLQNWIYHAIGKTTSLNIEKSQLTQMKERMIYEAVNQHKRRN